jgi:hypothetical protein
MCSGLGLLMPLVYLALRRARGPRGASRAIRRAFAGGLVSLLAYGIVIYAMDLAPMGAVSALRETSVLFAALIGRLFLGDPWPGAPAGVRRHRCRHGPDRLKRQGSCLPDRFPVLPFRRTTM